MKKYQDMAACERISYYRDRIRDMTPPRSERERLLIDTFLYLIAENESLCEGGAEGSGN
jgi:hypothetical protein